MKQSHWLIQDKNITPSFIEDNLSLVKKLDFSFSSVSMSATGKIKGLELLTPKPYIFRCGTKIINAITHAQNLEEVMVLENNLVDNAQDMLQSLKNGVFFNSHNFNFKTYQAYDLPLLNNDVQYFSYLYDKSVKFKKDMFIKPSEDNKFFTGGIIPCGTTIGEFINAVGFIDYGCDQELVLSSIKNIAEEYRFFIVNNEIVTFSGYKFLGQNKLFTEAPKSLLETAKDYAALYAPHEVFVMDISQADGKYKIVEYNCFNGCALYLSDREKLFCVLDDYIKSNKLNDDIKNNKIAHKATMKK